MKKLVFLLPMLITYSAIAQSLCKVREPDKAKFKAKDKNMHVYFLRCHPTLPYAFSNRSMPPVGNKPEYLVPTMFNMKTGKMTPFQIPKGFIAEDMVPSPNGKYLYVDLGTSKKRYLGLYSLQDGKIIQKKLLNVQSNDFYSYPSPAMRDGKQMIMGRRGGLYLDTVDEKNGVLKQGPEICGEYKFPDRPYISPDGEYIGLAIENKMKIMKIKWQNASADGKSIPCEPVADLPESTGKVSFSPDNKKVVFHASQKDFLGRKINNDYYNYDPQSFMMDLTTGETIQLTATENGKRSEYPYFCGNQGIAVREDYGREEKASATIKIISIPKTKDESCGESSDEHRNLIGFWEAVCEELYPSIMKPSYDVQVTKSNCDELLKVWRKKKNSSRFKEEELLAACK